MLHPNRSSRSPLSSQAQHTQLAPHRTAVASPCPSLARSRGPHQNRTLRSRARTRQRAAPGSSQPTPDQRSHHHRHRPRTRRCRPAAPQRRAHRRPCHPNACTLLALRQSPLRRGWSRAATDAWATANRWRRPTGWLAMHPRSQTPALAGGRKVSHRRWSASRNRTPASR